METTTPLFLLLMDILPFLNMAEKNKQEYRPKQIEQSQNRNGDNTRERTQKDSLLNTKSYLI